jgi:hypothetical protein
VLATQPRLISYMGDLYHLRSRIRRGDLSLPPVTVL